MLTLSTYSCCTLAIMTTHRTRRTRIGTAALAVALSAGCSATRASVDTASTGSVAVSSAPVASTFEASTQPSFEVGATTSPPEQDATGCMHVQAPTTVAYTTIPGIDSNLTSVDIYSPAAARCDAPVVMWVHGGGYQIGDKRNQIRDKVKLFNDAGWILVSVNYRLSVPGQAHQVGFPDHYTDVASAVAWVHDHIASYGGNPTKIALLGHSAGADIVANVATNPAFLQQVGLDLTAIRCAGPLDTEGFDKATANTSDPDGERQQWKQALGNNPDYITATSATLLVKPGIGIPPMIGVVRGTPQRQQIETAFLAALGANGIETITIDARTLTHAEVNANLGAPGDAVMTAPIMTFLTECFK